MVDYNWRLANEGCDAYERVLRLLGLWQDASYATLAPAYQLAEIERAAAIRRRVVQWGLTAEEDGGAIDLTMITLDLGVLDELVAAAAVFLSTDNAYGLGRATRARQRRRLEDALAAVDGWVDRAVEATHEAGNPEPSTLDTTQEGTP